MNWDVKEKSSTHTLKEHQQVQNYIFLCKCWMGRFLCGWVQIQLLMLGDQLFQCICPRYNYGY